MIGKVLSIEVGINVTRVIYTDYMKKNPKVYESAKFPTPEGTLIDGEVQLNDDFVNLLALTIVENHMTCKHVVFSISSSKIASREVTIPNVKEKQIASLVEVNASDYFPIDLSKYRLGHVVMGKVQEGSIEKIKLLVLAFPLSLINSYVALAEAIGKQVVAIDYSGHSIFQMVKNQCKEGLQMVIKMDEQSSIITLLRDQSIALQRNISYGIDDAIQAIIANRPFGVGNYDAALELAMRERCMISSLAETVGEGEDTEKKADEKSMARKNVSSSLSMFLNGVNRVMDYYVSKNNGVAVEKIYLTGIGAELKGIERLMTNELGIETICLRTLEGYSFEKYFGEGRFSEYITCIGGAMSPLGLVEEKKEKIAKTTNIDYTPIAILVCVCGIVLSGIMAITSMARYNGEVKNQSLLNQKLIELEPAKKVYETYVAIASQQTKVDYLYKTTENPNEYLRDFIDELEQILPESFYTTSFASDANGVSMTITVAGKEAAAMTIRNIRNMESIDTVNISGISDTKDEAGNHSVSFSISATYKALDANEDGAQEGVANE